jgi:hypothetical protein
MTTKKDIWTEWTGRYIDTGSPTPLFETDENLAVQDKDYGQNDRRILKRSEKMEARLRQEGRKMMLGSITTSRSRLNSWNTRLLASPPTSILTDC